MANNRLFVSNLSGSATTTDLENLFSQCGNVIDLYIPKDKQTKRPKGMAFVEMNSPEEAVKAREKLNRFAFKGKNLSISFAKERSQRQAPMVSRGPVRNPKKSLKSQITDFSVFVKKAAIDTQEVEYIPQHSFADFALDARVRENVAQSGYTNPTPIQDQIISVILEGNDVIGIANTGTGKTGAFLLPLITKILNDPDQKALIVSPTRELAAQIYDELAKFAKGTGIYGVLCIGGSNINPQIQRLRKNPSFVIGTPGRLRDLASTRHLHLQMFNNIVLDEVDRMLDMGFIDDIKYIIHHLPEQRQSLFFSATIPSNLRPVMDSFLRNPITVSVKKNDTADSIEQDIVTVTGRNKIDILHELLIQEGFTKVLVFGRTKHGVEKISKELQKRGFKAGAIHGDKTQARRQQTLQLFKEDRLQILVATDVAARGLDISNVSHVINYDMPQTYEDYIHRIGRTGRANQRGIALTFVDERDQDFV